MEIKNLLDAKTRDEFRQWLSKNHGTEKECWVRIKRDQSADDSKIFYIDAVEEALCFGWIDSTAKKISDAVTAQRFSPRTLKSPWSELNKERVRRMEKLGKMTDAGRSILPDMSPNSFVIDPDVLKALKADEQVYQNFLSFPLLYQRVRIDTIQVCKKQPDLLQRRLQKLLENTKCGIMYGGWSDNGRLTDY